MLAARPPDCPGGRGSAAGLFDWSAARVLRELGVWGPRGRPIRGASHGSRGDEHLWELILSFLLWWARQKPLASLAKPTTPCGWRAREPELEEVYVSRPAKSVNTWDAIVSRPGTRVPRPREEREKGVKEKGAVVSMPDPGLNSETVGHHHTYKINHSGPVSVSNPTSLLQPHPLTATLLTSLLSAFAFLLILPSPSSFSSSAQDELHPGVGTLWASAVGASLAYARKNAPLLKPSVRLIHARMHAQALTLAVLSGAAAMHYYDAHRSVPDAEGNASHAAPVPPVDLFDIMSEW
ncbi:hypothetical protein Taro_024756 [Colocasia esculenta]|uniref:HIG1 domain-containing protein n=1 Tax=Colocasia esculenta TaxID=4460 RepID=A0A843VLA2_COLES|nr:hypothetical protein [Colocasia esculenta]